MQVGRNFPQFLKDFLLTVLKFGLCDNEIESKIVHLEKRTSIKFLLLLHSVLLRCFCLLPEKYLPF